MVNKKILETINILADNQCIDCWHYECILDKLKMNHYCKLQLIKKPTEWSNSCSKFKQTTSTRFFQACRVNK